MRYERRKHVREPCGELPGDLRVRFHVELEEVCVVDHVALLRWSERAAGYHQDGSHLVAQEVAEPVVQLVGHVERQLGRVELLAEGERGVPVHVAVWRRCYPLACDAWTRCLWQC